MKRVFAFVIAVSAAAPAIAQTPPAPAQQPPARTELSAFLKSQHRTMKLNLSESAAKMPEDAYGFRPAGVATEVRTWGQFIGHLVDANNLYCSFATGADPAARPRIEDKSASMSKADLVKALNESLAFCDGAYDALTDGNALETVKIKGPNNTTREVTRAQYLIANLAHNNEHYGNLVTYLRAKGLVPPSTERAQAPRK
jgi:uncharacterized damage-inducible protein DinB